MARSLGRRCRVGIAAADGTGLETRHVGPNFLRRAGRDGKRTRRYTRFPKLNILRDCRTHLILAAHAGQGPAPDVVHFARLVRAAARRARMTRLVADAGYDGEAHDELAHDELGITTTIPPTRGRPSASPPTGKYRRLMRRRFNRRRWQVEAVFSSMKRWLGSAVGGQSHWARCSDLWLVVLTHNIMLLWRVYQGFPQSRLIRISVGRLDGDTGGSTRSLAPDRGWASMIVLAEG